MYPYFLEGKNSIEIGTIFDLPFTFLMSNVSGWLMLPDTTVTVLDVHYSIIV